MKKQLNEIKRMQQLAGILKEGLEDYYETLTNEIKRAIEEMDIDEYVKKYTLEKVNEGDYYLKIFVDPIIKGKTNISEEDIKKIAENMVNATEEYFNYLQDSPEVDNPFEDPNY